jgi:hypothetical protein
MKSHSKSNHTARAYVYIRNKLTKASGRPPPGLLHVRASLAANVRHGASRGLRSGCCFAFSSGCPFTRVTPSRLACCALAGGRRRSALSINRAQATGKKGTGRCWFKLVFPHSVAASPVAAEILARKKWSSLASSSRPSSSSCCCCCPQVRWCGRLAVSYMSSMLWTHLLAGGRRQPTDDESV